MPQGKNIYDQQSTQVETVHESNKSDPAVLEKTPPSTIPHYKGVQQVLREAKGLGVVAYNDALIRESTAAMKQQIEVQEKTIAVNLLHQRNMQLEDEIRAWKEQNPTGEGLTEFATSRYLELTDEAEQASTSPNVYNIIKLQKPEGLEAVANKYFGEENTQRKLNALSTIDAQYETVYRQVFQDPEGFHAHKSVYEQIQKAHEIASPQHFAQNKNNYDDAFALAYAQGEIHKDPYAAKNMLGENKIPELLSGMMTTKTYLKAKQEAYAEINKREHVSDAVKLAMVHDRKMARLGVEDDIINAVKFAPANVQSKLTELDNNGYFTPYEKNKIKRKVAEIQESQKDIIAQRTILNQCAETGEVPPAFVEDKMFVEMTRDVIAAENNRRFLDSQNSGENYVPVNILEAFELCNKHPVLNKRKNNVLRTMVINSLNSENISEAILSASIVVSQDNNKILGKFEDEECLKSEVIISTYLANKDIKDNEQVLALVKNTRDKVFHKFTKEEKDARMIEYKNTTFGESPREELKEYLKKKVDFNWFTTWDIDNKKKQAVSSVWFYHREKMIEIHRRAYLQFGSTEEANKALDNYISKMFAFTTINGRKELLYNPPTPECLGLESPVFETLLDHEAKNALNKSVFGDAKNIVPVENLLEKEKEILSKEGKGPLFKYKPISVGHDGKKKFIYMEPIVTNVKEFRCNWYLMESDKYDERVYLVDFLGNKIVTDFKQTVKKLAQRKSKKYESK